MSLNLRRIALAALCLPIVWAGKTSTVANWGENPSNLPAMLVYTPDKIAEKPAIIIGVCLFLLHVGLVTPVFSTDTDEGDSPCSSIPAEGPARCTNR